MNLTAALQRWAELEPIREHVKWKANDLPALECALRDAIEVRGLSWVTGHETKVRFIGRLFSEDTAIERDSSSSAAHALLLAYIAYLEGLVKE